MHREHESSLSHESGPHECEVHFHVSGKTHVSYTWYIFPNPY